MASTTLTDIIPTHASVSAFRANPTTPSFPDDQQWIAAYMNIHMMSSPSYRVAYLFWFFIAFFFFVASCAHCFGVRGTSLGAYWSKWALRRRTWQKRHASSLARKTGQSHRQPLPLPSNAQLSSLLCLFVVALVLSFVGPDYIAPHVGVFSFINDSPVANVRRRSSYYTSKFAQYQPQYTIPKAWWTVGGRTGLISFALLPLCVLFALKAPPFALFSIPFTIQIHFDKLACLHRWTGRLIWFVVALHVAAWSVQLAKDSRSVTNKTAYTYSWQYGKFIYGWIAFGLLTLVILLSLRPVRRPHYEAFYFLHVLLVPLMLVASALHHPPLQWWAYSALGLWVCERLWRATWWLHINGYFGGITANAPRTVYDPPRRPRSDAIQMNRLSSASKHSSGTSFVPQHGRPFSQSTTTTLVNRMSSTVDDLVSPPATYIPPPGYAHVELLPGRVVRLKFVTPGYRQWSPGQHFLISIPCVSKFTSHPFTAASLCDDQSGTDAGRALVFFIRSKSGWTKDLWDTVVNFTARGLTNPVNETLPKGSHLPLRGVLMRAFVEGPFGSAARINWDSHSTAVIVAGGSGVSFGLSVLEYLCLCLSGRDGKDFGSSHGVLRRPKFLVTRVRFVWLVREFGHIQWCASVLRRCMALVTPPVLQVNIFVTNVLPSPVSNMLNSRVYMPPSHQHLQQRETDESNGDHLMPPVIPFSPDGSTRSNSPVSDEEYDGLIDLSYYSGDNSPNADDEWRGRGHELDLTNFDGDDDTELPGEAQLSYRLKKEGITRRAKTRRLTMALGLGGKRRKDSVDSDVDERRLSTQKRHNRFSGPSATRLVSPRQDRVYSTRLSASKLEIDTNSARLSSPRMSSPLSPEGSNSGISPVDRESRRFSGPVSRSACASPTPSFFDGKSDAHSVAALMPQTGVGADGEEVKLDFDERELHDVAIVAEYARPGRPKLDRLLADEVERAKGSIIVACCGPTSLNTVMRKHVAAQIDPGRVRRGDMCGSITFVSEDFEY